MKHKFSLFFNFNAWLCIIAGVLLFIFALKNNKSTEILEILAFSLSSFGCAASLFITNYVIQILFDCRNFLQQLNLQSDTNNNSQSHYTSRIFVEDSSANTHVVAKNVEIENKNKESILQMKIGEGVDWGAWIVAIIVLLTTIFVLIKK